MSEPGNFERREQVRTWWVQDHIMGALADLSLKSSSSNGRIFYKFYVGNPKDAETLAKLNEEQKRHDDVVILDMVDTYYNLTLKTRLALDHASQTYTHASFIGKTDDDIYICYDRLETYLKRLPIKESVYMGAQLDVVRNVIREPGHRWALTKEEYPLETFPSYASGGLCILFLIFYYFLL
eukprot:TRINITY_DN26378_c0_g1_i1.p1 TRINITY_DN26378_c0_g1~~TRINITY_DN26378_c0_g1_i1.p1  ORF type:complete len:191 (+),score=11.96 TRINITY_DN26378_c0_g1_i1:31-573(+)